MSLTAEQIQELETKHKRIAVLRGADGAWEMVIRRPARPEYKHFRAMLQGAQAADAQEVLVRKLCVYPDAAAFDAMLDEWPGIPEAAGEAIKRLSGLSASDDVK